MPRFEITGPDGHKYEVTAPEGATEQDALAQVQKEVASQPAAGGTTRNTVGGLPLQSASGQTFTTGHVGEVAAEAFREAPKLYNQQDMDAAASTIFGAFVNRPLMTIANLPLQVGNAAFRGGQQLVQEALSPVSPQLGRDVAAAPEAFMGSPHFLRSEIPRIPRPNDLMTQARTALTPEPVVTPAIREAAEAHTARMAEPVTLERLTDAVRRADEPAIGSDGRPLTAEGQAAARYANESPPPRQPEPEIPTVTVRAPREPVPVGPDGRPMSAEQQAAAANANEPATARAVGAQVTTEPIPEPTRAQAQTNFEKDVRQTAEERAGPQGVDNTAYLEGAERSEAARHFDPGASVYEDALRDTDPKFDKQVRALEDEGKRIAEDKFNALAGDKNAIDVAVEERRKFSPDALGVFEKEAPTEMGAGIVRRLDRLLAGPEGKRSGVRSVLKSVRDEFLDADGNPEALPSMLYGGRKNITDWLDRARGTGDLSDSARAAQHFLTELLHEHVDPAITHGAPKFEEFRSKWSELSRPIDRMEFLQQHKFGPGSIYGTDGKVQFGSIQKLLEKMVKFQNAGGANAVKSFDPEHLQALVAIRNELAAWHLRDRLGKGAGSPTVKKATAAANLQSGPLGKAIQYGAEAAAHGAALAVSPGWGNAALLAARPAAKRVIESRAAKKLERLKTRMLETAPRNDLMP